MIWQTLGQIYVNGAIVAAAILLSVAILVTIALVQSRKKRWYDRDDDSDEMWDLWISVIIAIILWPLTAVLVLIIVAVVVPSEVQYQRERRRTTAAN